MWGQKNCLDFLSDLAVFVTFVLVLINSYHRYAEHERRRKRSVDVRRRENIVNETEHFYIQRNVHSSKRVKRTVNAVYQHINNAATKVTVNKYPWEALLYIRLGKGKGSVTSIENDLNCPTPDLADTWTLGDQLRDETVANVFTRQCGGSLITNRQTCKQRLLMFDDHLCLALSSCI